MISKKPGKSISNIKFPIFVSRRSNIVLISISRLLNCPTVTTIETSSELGSGAVAGIVVASIVGVALIALVVRMIQGERQGKPLFAPAKGEVS